MLNLSTKAIMQKFSFFALLALALVTSLAPVPAATAAQSARKTAKKASWISLSARTGKARYQVGEPIEVSLRATNVQSRDAYLKFASGQRFDLQLFRADKAEPVYSWSANKMFAMAVSHILLKQSQSENYSATIGGEMGELAPGNYRLQAHLTNSSQIEAPPVEFAIEAATPEAATPEADAQPLQLTATTDKASYAIGEAVKINFSLRNTSEDAVKLNFNSGQTYDVYIRNAAGDLVWSWAANKRFIMATRQIELAAGATQTFDVEWDGRALPDYQIEAGQYTIEAIYTSTPEIRAEPITIQVG